MLRLGRLVLPAVVAAASVGVPLSVAAPASGAVTGGTTTGDVVLYDHCQQHPIDYQVEVGALTTPWRIEVQVLDPSGLTSQGAILNSATNPPLSGTLYYQFCGSEPVGTWTVRSTIRYTPVNLVPTTLPDTTFRVEPMATQTTVTPKKVRDGQRKLVVRVQQQDEQGYVAADGIPVRLERQAGDTWTRVRGLTLTTTKGKAVALVRKRGTYRAVVTAHGNHAASTSAPVHTG